ncbi:MAG: peroxiredoxin [Candidatus Magasanikbacteria bacterium]|nr:peroxiredoxin [Candidatus Magasanikbacteria bacterium]
MEEHTHPLSFVGQQVPDISLEAFHQEKQVKMNLRDLAGKWTILFFYPADFTFVCPTELEEMADMYDNFKNLNTEVLSVSTDTAFVHKAWHDNSPAIKKVNFPMLADPTGKLCKALGTYIPEEGLSLRATFIIDPEGVIKAYEVHDNSIGRSAEELLRKLQAAQYVHEHGGEVCPAKWRPGNKTLIPSLELVGKI